MKTIFAATLLSFLCACAFTPQMNADQLKAGAADSTAGYIKYTGAGGQGEARFLNTEKGALGTNGGKASMDAAGNIEVVVNPKTMQVNKDCAPEAIEKRNGKCMRVERNDQCGINFSGVVPCTF